MRINKFLALSGIASRRAAEKLVLDGKVKINGRIVTELATEVDEHRDDVTVDGVKAVLPDVFSYFMFHKPKGCVTTASDDR
ncbi:MAG TPA: S4 domain-containing protein, partial [Clostridia bacterium]|nr:S4 domain-containing protein [Clostridia bacterium]